MQAAGADPKHIQQAEKQLRTYRKQLDEMRSATEGVSKALTNLDRATPRQLEKALRTLNRQLKDMTPGTATWQSHIEKIQQLHATGTTEATQNAGTRPRVSMATFHKMVVSVRAGRCGRCGWLSDPVDHASELRQ